MICCRKYGGSSADAAVSDLVPPTRVRRQLLSLQCSPAVPGCPKASLPSCALACSLPRQRRLGSAELGVRTLIVRDAPPHSLVIVLVPPYEQRAALRRAQAATHAVAGVPGYRQALQGAVLQCGSFLPVPAMTNLFPLTLVWQYHSRHVQQLDCEPSRLYKLDAERAAPLTDTHASSPIQVPIMPSRLLLGTLAASEGAQLQRIRRGKGRRELRREWCPPGLTTHAKLTRRPAHVLA